VYAGADCNTEKHQISTVVDGAERGVCWRRCCRTAVLGGPAQFFKRTEIRQGEVAVSSCEAERSFSSLRRLKTWLCNTMTQERLNAVVVCHVHQDVLDNADISELAADFTGR